MGAQAITAPSANVTSLTPSAERVLEESLQALADHAQEFARLPVTTKAALLRECMPRVREVAPEWVRRGCQAKGLPPAEAGEEWLAGPMPTLRNLRLLAESLDSIAATGKPPLGRKSHIRSDGHLEIEVFPSSGIDAVLFTGFKGTCIMQSGVGKDDARRLQAEFYSRKDPEGGVSLVLGAGNVSSIPPMDVLTKMFIEGFVCILKMNPVNEWVGPYLEKCLAPLIERNYLRIVYGGAAEGKYLCEHSLVADVHMTGSDKTHDTIVWGPAGPERDRRIANNDPLLAKPISSELGNVSPVAIVPYTYSESELRFQARNVVSMVVQNGSFNCNAAKLLVTAKGWDQRDRFLSMVEEELAKVPTRKAYYPGAFNRYHFLTDGRDNVLTFGSETEKNLPWALIRGVDADDREDPIFFTEPFCSILSETSVGSADPIEFLGTLTTFLNERVWGTLNATLIIHPKLERDPAVARELDRAIVDLRYGCVAINHWAAVCYGSTTMPWGGHQSVTLDDIQSGLGWVHNTFMLGGIDKSVVRGPIKVWPDPVWFPDNRSSTQLGPLLVDMELKPSWLKVPRMLLKALL